MNKRDGRKNSIQRGSWLQKKRWEWDEIGEETAGLDGNRKRLKMLWICEIHLEKAG